MPGDMYIDAHFYSPNTLGSITYFKNEETEGQRGTQAACPRSQSQSVAELKFGPSYG